MDECKIVLGWFINTRTMQISLPADKHTKWIFQINHILQKKRVSSKQLEVLIRRLNHIGSIMPMLCHFLSRLRNALFKATKPGWTCLSLNEQSNLYLMTKFLDRAYLGIVSIRTYSEHSQRSTQEPKRDPSGPEGTARTLQATD
jgi:hypothetical protein